jgi:hypothetical protein
MRTTAARYLRGVADRLDTPQPAQPPVVYIDLTSVPSGAFIRELRKAIRISGGVEQFLP